ncbi:MAG TPA: DUF1611 domain-containing protein [Candidatus Obscuribacter sp.]|nr:DUF1611 domain-containing protein [Candidatus Obscuribacter sp.]
MYLEPSVPLAIYAPDEFGKAQAKTAEGVLRYGRNPIACVIDAAKAGQTIKEVCGIDCAAPIVSTVEEALALKSGALLLGTAWSGGALPEAWKKDIKLALTGGMDVVNGLHDFLEEDPELKALAKTHGRRLFDVRKSPEKLPVARGLVMETDAYVVLTVGTDCSVGKMTVALEIQKLAQSKNIDAQFVATGQTGIMICGEGIAIDRVIGDFMAGATEKMVLEKAARGNLILVEGQGSLAHPGFSGVTLALLHGACPQALILCHRPARPTIKGTNFPISSYTRLIETYEAMASYMRPAKVIALALNTQDLNQEEALAAIKKAEAETGLPAADPVRFGANALLDAIEKAGSLSPIGK